MNIKDYVSKQASEWIGGIKKFLSFPYGPEDTPQEDYQLINKQYADTGIASLSVSISNLFSSVSNVFTSVSNNFSSVSGSLGAISSFLTNEVIWSSTCNRLVVSTTADPAPTEDDIWIDMSRVPSIVSTTTDYTLLSTDYLILANASGGMFSIVLGSAPVHAFRNYFIKKIDSSNNKVLINPNGVEQIDGSVLYQIVTQNESLHIASDAVKWYSMNRVIENWKPLTDCSVTAGTPPAGSFSIGDVNVFADGLKLSVQESAGTPGFNIRCYWNNIFDRLSGGVASPLRLVIRGYYAGTVAHQVSIQMYNYNSSAYDTIGIWDIVTGYNTYSFTIPNSNYYNNGSSAEVRLYHDSLGNASHYFNLDYAAMVTLR